MTTRPTWIPNRRDRAWTPPEPDPAALAFHRRLPGYAPTPLVPLPELAQELGVGRVFVKDESHRLGLPAFKALGASWAVHRALAGTDGRVTIVTATDGNHGRAVARAAVNVGQRALVLVPVGVHPDAVDSIRSEGADVVQVDGTYDAAVDEAARLGAQDGYVLVQDTAWDGYEEIPSWIVDGYETLFVEIDEQLAVEGVDRPDLVVVPTGVGSLLQAALVHYRSGSDDRTAVVSVEPESAACVHASVAARRPTAVPTGVTSMAGLNCGTVSTVAWPAIAAGLDAALVTSDASAAAAGLALAELGVDAGPCGAAPLAALRDVGPGDAAFRDHVGIDAHATVVLLVTEGTAANPHASGAGCAPSGARIGRNVGAMDAGSSDAPVTVTQALDLLHQDGYVEDFDLVDGALTCGKHVPCPVGDVVVERVYRFEGPSDPGDEMIVFGVLDPVSQVRGTLAAAFGPLADPQLYEHLSDLSTRLPP